MSEHHGDGVTRRDMLIGAAGGLALAAIDAPGALAQNAPANKPSSQVSGQVSGIVFEDRDGSGMSSAANPGLAGVLVSSSRDIAVTGPDGRYTLRLPEGGESDLRHRSSRGLHAAGRAPDQSAALLPPSSAQRLAGGSST